MPSVQSRASASWPYDVLRNRWAEALGRFESSRPHCSDLAGTSAADARSGTSIVFQPSTSVSSSTVLRYESCRPPELGNGSWDDSATPVTVAGITNATTIWMNLYTVCARLATGQVKCWGDGEHSGQLGNGELGTGEDEVSDTPVTVSGIKAATTVTTSDEDSCALLATHEIRCWGVGVDGTLGDGEYEDRATPVAVSGITNAASLSQSEFANCALLTTGQVECWGDDTWGKLGDGEYGLYSATPVTVFGLTTAAALASGDERTRSARSLQYGRSSVGVTAWLGSSAMASSTRATPEGPRLRC
jgi:alpha-tubulin suppressor-like RCC1 family protein